jgi:succinylglutamic semialdehyde dehydrogenase
MAKDNYINNQWVTGEEQEFTSVDAAKNLPLATVYSASTAQVEQAIAAAQQGFMIWRQLSSHERIAVIKLYQQKLVSHATPLAAMIAAETGKPLWEANAEVAAMIAKIDVSINAYFERTGSRQNGSYGVTHKPHGVVAVFGPYNFPGHLPNGHIVPALIAGNTVVFKPSELTPLVAIEMVRLWQQAGLPAGVVNLVQGLADVGQALAAHKEVKGLFFTGSSTTGQLLHRLYAGQTSRIMALEMGGNNPLIVTKTSDINAAVYHIIQSAFISSGQRCTCARRLFLPNTLQGDQILQALIEKTHQIIPGYYDEAQQPFIGSLISHQAAVAMLEAQREFQQFGARILVPMQIIRDNTGLLSPGIIEISDVYEKVPDEEHFGPWLKVIRYDKFSDAVKLANDTRFGLSAGLLSDDEGDYKYFKAHINAGIVNWNAPTTGAKGDAPFGGIGDSGNHRPGAYYAADYCAYPVASVSNEQLTIPSVPSPGLPF